MKEIKEEQKANLNLINMFCDKFNIYGYKRNMFQELIIAKENENKAIEE